ncbi:hypothetical protein W079_00850, partial [Mycobacterium tuberculosis TB_RSA169]
MGLFGKRKSRATRRAEARAIKAEAELKVAREGKLLSPTRIRRLLTVSRLLAP